MLRFLIATAANDIHAVLVELALRRIGHDCFRWVMSDYPSGQTCSIDIGSQPHWEIRSAEDIFALSAGDRNVTFWNRRVVSDHQVSNALCEADEQVARRECAAFTQSLLGVIDHDHRSINKVYAAKKAESKPLQLLSARSSGFEVPHTIVSNNPELIRSWSAGVGVNLVAKPFSPTIWKGPDQDFITRSGILKPELLPDDEFLQACPMIFQPYVEKAFEVRITCFGDLAIGVRLDSQRIAAAKIDWRAVSPARLGVERVDLPAKLHRSCATLMATLKLEFACIDMIVTPAGEWIFLELNQMGQFLWIEEVCPDIPMLDLFVQLLVGTRRVDSPERLYGLRYDEFSAEASAQLRVEQPLRVPKAGSNVVVEPQ